MVDLRATVVKRQALTTVEVLARPIHGRRHTHLVTGYVHKPYPRIYAMLARHAGFDSALLIRGVEGGVIPSLRQTGTCFNYQGRGEEQSFEIDPVALGIEQSRARRPAAGRPAPDHPSGDDIAVAVDVPATARAAAEAGLAALGASPDRPTTAWSSPAPWSFGTWAGSDPGRRCRAGARGPGLRRRPRERVR